MREKILALFSKYKELSEPVKASIWFTVCNILNKGIALLSTPIFTRLLTTEEYGDFTVFQSWYSILIIFATCNLFIGAYGKGLLEFDKNQEEYTSSLLGLTTFITFIVFIIYLLNIDFWSEFFSLKPILMIALFVELFTMPAYEFWATKQRFEYKYKALIIISIAMSIFSILVAIMSIMLTEHRLIARIYSDVIIKAVIGTSIFVLLIWKGKILFNKRYWKYALVFNIPLIPHFLSTMILNQSDRIMIKAMIGSSSAAIYGIAYVIGTMVLLVVNAINNSFTPYVYQALKVRNYFGIKKNTNRLVILVAIMVCISMIFAPEIIYIFAGSEYYESINIIPPIAASVFFIFIYSIFSNIEYYYKKGTYIAIASILCAVINIILNYIMIPIFGYYAAGYTTLVCYMIYAINHFMFCRKILINKSIKLSDVFDINIYLIVALIVLCMMIFMVVTYKYIWVRYTIFIVILIVIWMFRKKYTD